MFISGHKTHLDLLVCIPVNMHMFTHKNVSLAKCYTAQSPALDSSLWTQSSVSPTPSDVTCPSRALCRIKLLPVTHVLVDTWMLSVKLVYKLSNVFDDLKWATNTHLTPFTLTFQSITNNIYGFGRPFFAPSFFSPSTTRPPYFYPSIFVFTRPDDGSLDKAMTGRHITGWMVDRQKC